MLSIKDAAKIFSSKSLGDVLHGDFDFIFLVAGRYYDSLGDVFCISDIYQACYEEVSKLYRFEYYIKNTIAQKILLGKYSLNTATLLGEFRVGFNKADCVILNGISTCYEIKSEYDSLARLPAQLSSYLTIFDKVNVVTSESHVSKVEAIAPDSVGVIKLGRRGVLTEIRPASLSVASIDVDVLIGSLRRNEYLEIVRELCGEVPASSNTAIYEECRLLLKTFDPSAVRAAFCKVVKSARGHDKFFMESLPRSLLVAGVEYRMTASDKVRLLGNINQYFSKDAICTTRLLRQNGTS